MSSCTSCGHQLGVGRFCTSCGAPVDSSTPDATPVSTPVTGGDWRTDTAERRLPSTDPRTPPSAVAPPPPPRYPLYADEVPGYTAHGPLVTAPDSASPELPAAGPATPSDAEPYAARSRPESGAVFGIEEERRSPVAWIVVTALVLGLLGAGWWFLVRDDGSGSPSAAQPSSGPGSASPTVRGEDVAGRASVKAPSTAPPNEDVDGNQVSYDASNMLDGVPETAWRTAGSAAGTTLTFTLRDPTELHQVGLVNGYAKTSTDAKGRTFDWYHGNRRVDAVIWVFDDGKKVRQQLKDTESLQLVDVPDVVTSKVLMKIVAVSKPGTGPAARDFTAISEVSLVGDPQP